MNILKNLNEIIKEGWKGEKVAMCFLILLFTWFIILFFMNKFMDKPETTTTTEESTIQTQNMFTDEDFEMP